MTRPAPARSPVGFDLRHHARLLVLVALTFALLPCRASHAIEPAGLDVMAVTDPEAAARHLHQIRQSDESLDDGEYAAAIPLLEELVARYPADGGLWDSLAYACYNDGRWERAAEAYVRAAEIGVPFQAIAVYNLACCQALDGQNDAAMSSLRRALALGFENRPLLQRDTDLVSLHDHPDWTEVAGLLPDEVASGGRVAGWRHDLRFWASEVRRLHPDPFRHVTEEAFDARVAALESRIDELTDEQMMMGLQRLTVLLGDGHSGIRPLPTSRVQLRRLPVQLYVFTDGLFVIDAIEAHEELVEAEVLRIGTRPVAELLEELEDVVARDNAMGLLDMGPLVLTVTAVLRDLGAIEDTEDVPLELRMPDGSSRDVVLGSAPMRSAHRELDPPPGLEPSTLPLYLAHESEVFWFEALPDLEDALYAQFNLVRDGPDLTIAEHAARLRRHLQDHPEIDVLALDLRHNGGGNSFLYPPLVRVLVEFQLERDEARLYVLAGRRTFSACQNLATDLDFWTDAVFVGEPTGSRPNQIGESTHSVLPYSGLRAGISSRYHQQSYPGDERPWIAPDLPVAFSSRDYFEGRDPGLEAILAAEEDRGE